ncbi:hypothetical protein KP79_PYT15040 [Mizuhopecten yessoensis]|uniref:Small EDRK-rich factor-like N-terminal domain-containing protein n=1 Tax=Mizuhopecten yessoensis TaxID=6573 RepID=A0A210QVV4_MIZYE|nr:hypothetical protein KP79_PYT15040 [Mizuhopecten yessoensis]
MTRGNQREKAREKNMKKQQTDKKKADNKATSLELRKQRCTYIHTYINVYFQIPTTFPE